MFTGNDTTFNQHSVWWGSQFISFYAVVWRFSISSCLIPLSGEEQYINCLSVSEYSPWLKTEWARQRQVWIINISDNLCQYQLHRLSHKHFDIVKIIIRNCRETRFTWWPSCQLCPIMNVFVNPLNLTMHQSIISHLWRLFCVPENRPNCVHLRVFEQTFWVIVSNNITAIVINKYPTSYHIWQ